MRRSVVLAALLSAGVALGLSPARGEERREQVAAYLHALEANSVGEIEAHAGRDSKRPTGPPIPYPDVLVLAVPYSAAFEAELDAIKRQQRDTMARYTETHAGMTAAIEAYEADLRSIGAGVLVRRGTSNSEGVLRLPGMPVGEWLVLGWREEAHALKPARIPRHDAGRFTPTPITTGYAAVSYWRVRVSVRPSETADVRLTDRSVWLTAVREDRVLPDAVPVPHPESRR